MIYDQVRNAHLYAALGERIARAIAFLTGSDLDRLEDGKYVIDADNVFATVSTYETKRPADAKAESHDRYIDLQYVISGAEYIPCGFRNEMIQRVEHRPADDISFYQGELAPCLLGNGRFMILFPDDVHAPGVCIDVPQTVRKLVIKIKV